MEDLDIDDRWADPLGRLDDGLGVGIQQSLIGTRELVPLDRASAVYSLVLYEGEARGHRLSPARSLMNLLASASTTNMNEVVSVPISLFSAIQLLGDRSID
jgi:hypothetical protein